MSAHVLLKYIKRVGKNIRIEDFRASYRFSPTSLINSLIQEHECEILFIICRKNRILFANFALKRHNFAIRACNVFTM